MLAWTGSVKAGSDFGALWGAVCEGTRWVAVDNGGRSALSIAP
jgi:hypothetical protein